MWNAEQIAWEKNLFLTTTEKIKHGLEQGIKNDDHEYEWNYQ